MDYRPFGRTGVQVSDLCLGCMLFGDDTTEEDSIQIINRALDEGINFLDTANVYNNGVSESIVGKALSGGPRSQVFLATKFYGRMGEGPNESGSHRYHIMKACEESLRRLCTDHIDLYQIHRPHPSVPIDETLRALDDLVRQGKVRYIGTSTFAAWQVVESLWASKELHLNRFISEQPPYNLLDRRIERELLPMCRTYEIATMPWAPLGSGLLSGRYRPGQPRPADARYANRSAPFNRDNEEAIAVIGKYLEFCEQRGVSPAHFALAWVKAQPGITSPIIGPRTMTHFEDCLKARELAITEEDKAAIDAIFPPGSHVSEYYKADFGPNARWL